MSVPENWQRTVIFAISQDSRTSAPILSADQLLDSESQFDLTDGFLGSYFAVSLSHNKRPRPSFLHKCPRPAPPLLSSISLCLPREDEWVSTKKDMDIIYNISSKTIVRSCDRKGLVGLCQGIPKHYLHQAYIHKRRIRVLIMMEEDRSKSAARSALEE